MRGALAMADCAEPGDVARAAATLCGYTDATRGTALPALALMRACAASAFAICEGGIGSPDDVRASSTSLSGASRRRLRAAVAT